MTDSNEEPASLDQVKQIASSLFGGEAENNEESKPSEEQNDDTPGGTENKDDTAADDNASKNEDDENNSNKGENDSQDNAEEKEETKESTEETEKESDAQDESKLEDQVSGLAGTLTSNEEKKEETESQGEKSGAEESQENKDDDENKEKTETEGETEKSETEKSETEKSETEKTETEKSETEKSETEKSETGAESEKEKTESENKEGLDSTLTSTLGDLAGTLVGENENKNEENETENEAENNNEDENSSAPVQEPSERKSATSPRRSTRNYYEQPVPESNYSDEELKQALDGLIKNNKAPENDMIPALRRYIESEMTEAALNQKYEYGVQLEKAVNTLNQITATDPKAILSETRRRESEERHATAKENYDKSVKEWEERISDYRKEQQKRISDLEEEHKRQMNEFEEQWSKPENMLEYNKPSPQLIRLRTTEQNLALQKNFERAKEVKAQADRLLREEQAEAQRRAVADMRLAYEAMDQRQRREMQCLLQHTQSTIESMERERDKCIVPMSQIVKRHKENSRPKTVRGSGARGLSETARNSPRPIRTKITATTIKPAIGLGINGIDVKQYIKPRKSTTMSHTPPGSPKK
ncbi:hypothetical protein M9Y10_009326 [Tritrichomonas musculus]|uniref:Uncharacterized protein n=1 Tax=Tritrichomonas musculus TaxID=1915356 RepID=A0ABR2IPF2_9EUKA